MTAPDRKHAPAVHNFNPPSLIAERVETLANGVEFHTLIAGEQPLLRLSLLWEGGYYDTAMQCLPSFFVEAMREGTNRYSGAEIADIIDFNGARLTTRTSDHYSGIDLLGLSDRFEAMLPVLYSIITAPTFADRAVDMIARKAAANRATMQHRVAWRASKAIYKRLRGVGHPASIVETPEQLAAVSPETVAGAYRSIVGGGRLHAFLAGRCSDDVLTAIKKFLQSLPCGDKSIIHYTPFKAEEPRTSVDTVADAQQSAVSLGMPTINREHPDYIDLRLAIVGLGGYFSSRLMTNIREEKGLTYGISSYLLGCREGAMMRIDAQCDAASVDALIAETRREISGLTDNPIDGDELMRLRLNAWASLAATADSPFATMDYYITQLLVGTPTDYFERQLNAVKVLTADRIATVAAAHLNPDRLHIAVCGPGHTV